MEYVKGIVLSPPDATTSKTVACDVVPDVVPRMYKRITKLQKCIT